MCKRLANADQMMLECLAVEELAGSPQLLTGCVRPGAGRWGSKAAPRVGSLTYMPVYARTGRALSLTHRAAPGKKKGSKMATFALFTYRDLNSKETLQERSSEFFQGLIITELFKMAS